MAAADAIVREALAVAVLGLEAAAAFVIIVGALRALARFVRREVTRSRLDGLHIRGEFGRSLLLGLDFAIGSDVLKVAVAPTYEQVGITALVVVVRTVLTFVLEFEVNRDRRERDRQAPGGKTP